MEQMINILHLFIKCEDLKIDYGKTEWGAENGIIYYVLKLGEILNN